MTSYEDEEAFLCRRVTEETVKAAQTACIVRSVHEDLAEIYEKRRVEAAQVTANLIWMLDRI